MVSGDGWSPLSVCRPLVPFVGTHVVPRQPHERACVGGGAGARGTQGLPGEMAGGSGHGEGLEGITSNWRYHIWGRRPPDMAGGMNILMGIRTRIPAEIIQGVSSRDGIHAGAERHGGGWRGANRTNLSPSRKRIKRKRLRENAHTKREDKNPRFSALSGEGPISLY
jgi:hypothetical protein